MAFQLQDCDALAPDDEPKQTVEQTKYVSGKLPSPVVAKWPVLVPDTPSPFGVAILSVSATVMPETATAVPSLYCT